MHRRPILIASALLAAVLLSIGVGWAVRESAPVAVPPPVVPSDDPALLGVFEGRVPCADCERIKVRLTLFAEHPSEPTNYLLELIHVGAGDERQVSEGTWSIDRGTASDPDATTYGLDDGAPAGYRSYQLVGDDILLFLDAEGELVVGDAGHSFTLSRTR